MGLDELRLVRPLAFPSNDATAMAAGAADVLARATTFDSVDAAVADCGLIVGTTSRSRGEVWRIDDPRSVAADLVQAAASTHVAILFGCERTGLENAELAQCHRLLTIPTSLDYASLNLAMAVQIVAYELWVARASHATVRADGRTVPLASALEMDKFYDHLQQVLDEVGFHDRTGEGHLFSRLRRLFNRACPDENEVHILRGILTAVQGRRRRAGDPHGAASR